MLNNNSSLEVADPAIKPKLPDTPEKTKEAPIKVPNPFVIPVPKIQPNTKPIPKA